MTRTRSRSLLLAAVLATLLVATTILISAQAEAAPGDLSFVSKVDGASGDPVDAFAPAADTAGNRVAFYSKSSLLGGDVDSNDFDIYVRDVTTNQTIPASADAPGTATQQFNDPSISADGGRVGFQRSLGMVYLYDIDADTTERIDVDSSETPANNGGNSFNPELSGDGRYVAFSSNASNLHPTDTDAADDVFVRDTLNGTTDLASRLNGATGEDADDECDDPSISADGRLVAMECDGSLDPADTDSKVDIYVRDMVAGTTTLVSTGAGGKANGDSVDPSISGDGSKVAFLSAATNLPGDTDDKFDLFVRDLGAATTAHASIGENGANPALDVTGPAISADGARVAFASSEAELSDDDSQLARNDAFVRDLPTATTRLVSRAAGTNGALGDDASNTPDLSGDGTIVVFQSSANNLVPSVSANGVFRRELEFAGGGPGPNPPPDPPGTDDEIIDLNVTTKKKQKQKGKKIKIAVSVGAGEKITAKGSGKVKTKKPKASYTLKPQTKAVESGERTTLKLKPRSKKHAKKISKAIKKWKKASSKRKKKLAVKASIKITATDDAGNKQNVKRVVTLK